MIIDSVTAYMYIQPTVFDKVAELLKRAIPVRSANDPDPKAGLKRLCLSRRWLVFDDLRRFWFGWVPRRDFGFDGNEIGARNSLLLDWSTS
ncbi:hypothetical protein ACOSQ2_004336 [Xanthoceras sorbifolium]